MTTATVLVMDLYIVTMLFFRVVTMLWFLCRDDCYGSCHGRIHRDNAVFSCRDIAVFYVVTIATVLVMALYIHRDNATVFVS